VNMATRDFDRDDEMIGSKVLNGTRAPDASTVRNSSACGRTKVRGSGAIVTCAYPPDKINSTIMQHDIKQTPLFIVSAPMSCASTPNITTNP
jgi:hypothetical protein